MHPRDLLSLLAQFAPIASAMTAMIAAVFVLRQLNNIRRSREIDTLFKIISLVDSERMCEALDWLRYEVSRNPNFAQVKADRHAFRKFSNAVHLFETMGVIANRGYVSEGVVFDKYGLLIVGAWHKLESLINAHRSDSQSKEYAENFELLVSRYDEWARRNALKCSRGDRIRLRDGRHLLHHGENRHE